MKIDAYLKSHFYILDFEFKILHLCRSANKLNRFILLN